ncbi:MAG TPA: thiamine ABC transporter substrate-binding protein [Phototrophicaceae bacterium]|nr:thiamine ABC transporter substrate-binding protein [Phototrophicaceae bacterium]
MVKRLLFLFLLLIVAAPVVQAQDSTAEATASGDNTLIVVSHDSFTYTDSVMQKFEDESGITVKVLRSGDAGAMVNQSILSKDNPLGDVMYGVDNTFLSRALNADLFVPYKSPELANVPAEFQVDSQNRVTPIDYGDVCINYDTKYFSDHNLALPTSLKDLIDPKYNGLLVVENPAISSPGLAFLIATVAAFGDSGSYTYLDYWNDLVKNNVDISDDWTDAYYTEFSGSSGSKGTHPLVVSYASSPPAEVLGVTPEPDTSPVGTILADGTCFRQIEFAGVLNGGKNPAAAQKFIDFLLSTDFQEDMPLQMYVFPVNSQARLPDLFTKFALIPPHPVEMSIDQISAGRDQWIQAWTETVLR